MITLPADQVAALPVDKLALVVLDDLIASQEWNEYSYLLVASRAYSGEALEVIAEALTWLRSRALIARTPGQIEHAAIFVTRTGRRLAAEGPASFYAAERLQSGLHPLLVESVARPQFLIGEYELAVFAAMKAVEVRVRRLAGLGCNAFGTDLMRKAFGTNGPLTDLSANKGEQDGTRELSEAAAYRGADGHQDLPSDGHEAVAVAITEIGFAGGRAARFPADS